MQNNTNAVTPELAKTFGYKAILTIEHHDKITLIF